MTGLLPHQLLASAQQNPQFLGRPVGNETPPDQSVRQQVRQPSGIAYVSLAARQIFDMRCIRQNELHVSVSEHMPDRLPVNARGLHRRVRTAILAKPVGQCHQTGNRCRKRLDLGDNFVTLDEPDRRDNVFLVNVEPSATLMQYFHLMSPPQYRRRRDLIQRNLIRMLHGRSDRLAIVRGAPRSHGPTQDRAKICTKEKPTSVPTVVNRSNRASCGGNRRRNWLMVSSAAGRPQPVGNSG